MTIKVEKDSIEANKVKEEAQAEERGVNAHAEEIRKTQEEADAELAKATPILEAAIEALN